jgi:opacity protein-like surface antigen
MKKIVTLVAMLAIVSAPAFAAPKKKTTVKTTTTTTTDSSATAANSSPSYSSSSAPMHNGLLVSGELGLGTLGSKFAFGFGLRVESPMSLEGNHVRFGLQTGFYYGPSDPSTWTIPILAIGTYDFRVTSGTIKPYVGLGLGVAISHANGVDVPGFGTIGGGSSTDFAWQLKPGAGFGNEGKMYVELPLGTISGTFYIIPSIGMHF